MLYIKIFIILTLFGFYYCYSQPSWINEKEKYYPTSKYLSAIGISENLETAQAQAFQGVLSQIKVKISGTIKSSKSEISNEIQESITNNITATAEGSLTNVEFVKTENYKSQFYVLAVLDKNKYILSIGGELRSLTTKLDEQNNLISNNLNNGKLLFALNEAQDFYMLYDAVLSKKVLYDAVSTKPFTLSTTFDASDLDEEIKSMLSSLKLEVISGIGQKGLAGSLLREPVKIFASYTYKNSAIPISNFAICILDESDKILDKNNTNNDGNVSFYIIASPTSSNKGRVKIAPYFLHFPNLFNSYLKNIETSLNFEVVNDMPLEMTFNVYDEEKNEIYDVQKRLAQNITKLGHTIRTVSSELSFELNFNNLDTKIVSGIQGDQYLVKIEGIFSLKINLTDELIGSFSTTTMGLGNSEEKAVKTAYQKIQLDKNKFAEIINNGKDAIKRAKEKYSNERFIEAEVLYAKENLQDAIEKFSQVTADEYKAAQARQKITEIRDLIQSRIEAEFVRKMREKELELENLKVSSFTQIKLASIYSKTTIQVSKIEAAKDVKISSIEAKRDINLSKIDASKDITISNIESKRDVNLSKIQSKNDIEILKVESSAELRRMRENRLYFKTWINRY